MSKPISPKKIKALLTAVLPLLIGMKIGEAVRRLSTPEKKTDE